MSFKNLSQALKLVGKVDLDKLAELSDRVDVERLLDLVAGMDEGRLQALVHSIEQSDDDADELPEPDGDFLDLAATLEPEQRALRDRVRAFMEAEVEPVVAEHWENETFPRDIIRTIRHLDLLDVAWGDDGSRMRGAATTEGIVLMELARVDPSVATFVRVQMGPTMMAVHLCGDEAQRREWLPRLKRWDVLGASALAEPDGGPAVGQGSTATCRLDGDAWVVEGVLMGMGNVGLADIAVVWAQDSAGGETQAFLVPIDSPGARVDETTGKLALRALEVGHVTLEGCRIPDSHRLQRTDPVRATADVRRATRAGALWTVVGAATGAYERVLAHVRTRSRTRSGRPLASVRWVQDHLVQMLADVTAMQLVCARLSRLQDADGMRAEHASLAGLFCAGACRAVVARAREVLGADGISADYDLARFLSDVEAVCGYVGTRERDYRVVGRVVAGVGVLI